MAIVKNPDHWGYGIGTQAARLNRMLAGSKFLSVEDMYKALVMEFPSTTRSRVSSHMTSLRRKQRGHLQERREGRIMLFRLVGAGA